MCGIAGKLIFDGHADVDQELIDQALSSLEHRGPDEKGFHVEPGVFIGANRLKIVDPLSGSQPLCSDDQQSWIVFNGEIYNFLELRAQLKRLGYTFKTQGDAEVVLKGYLAHGPAFLSQLNGMFAIAIWNNSERSLFLARDRVGIKPLYYAHNDLHFFFASEPKAIIKDTSIARDIDNIALDLYLSLGYIPHPYSIYKSIRKLAPAHYLKVSDQGLEIRKYWELRPQQNIKAPYKELKDEFLYLLQDSIRLRLKGALPVSLFLSGGLDSSAIAALSSKMEIAPQRAYTMSFKRNSIYDEAPFAQSMASISNIPLTIARLSRDELHCRFDDYVVQFDEPFADFAAIPTLLLCSMAAKNDKIVATGDGCDELFGGYWRHRSEVFADYFRKIPRPLQNRLVLPVLKNAIDWKLVPARYETMFTRALRKLGYASRSGNMGYVLAQTSTLSSYSDILTDGRIHDQMATAFGANIPPQDSGSEALNRKLLFDIYTSLPEVMLYKIDRCSMKYGLEARVPFLDHRLVEFSTKVPSKWKASLLNTKIFIRRVLRDFLPREIVQRPKHGFSPPLVHWIRHELKDRWRDELHPDRLKQHNILNPSRVSRLLNDHLSGRRDNSRELFILWALTMWKDQYG